MDQSLEQIAENVLANPSLSFNPYFSGSVTGTYTHIFFVSSCNWVSILILVDQSLEHINNPSFFSDLRVSILILVDQSLELNGIKLSFRNGMFQSLF